MIPAFLLRFFELDVLICIESGSMRRGGKRFRNNHTDLFVTGGLYQRCVDVLLSGDCSDCSADVPYIYNTRTKELRTAPGRCPTKPSIICSEHLGKSNVVWEPCGCCPNKEKGAKACR